MLDSPAVCRHDHCRLLDELDLLLQVRRGVVTFRAVCQSLAEAVEPAEPASKVHIISDLTWWLLLGL